MNDNKTTGGEAPADLNTRALLRRQERLPHRHVNILFMVFSTCRINQRLSA